MKLGPVTKLGKKNKTMSKRLDDGAMSGKCDIIPNFPIYGQFGVMRKPGSVLLNCKS